MGSHRRNTPERRIGSAEPLLAALLLLVAVLLRILTIRELAGDLRIQEPILDAQHYLSLAAQLSQGQGWPAVPHFFGPLYPALLSLLFRFASATPLTVQIAQSILGLGTLALLALTTRRWLGRQAAWAAAVLFVLYGPVLAMESQVLMEPLLLFLVAGALWLWPSPDRRPPAHLFFGMACGLLAAGRAIFLLLPAAAMLVLLMQRRPADTRRWVGAALIVLGVLLPMLPQAIHQTRTTGHPQLLTLNGGLNLYVGNNAYAKGIFSLPPDLDLNDDLTGTRSASIQAGRQLTLEESSRYWAQRAAEFAREQPGRAAGLVLRKALLFLTPDEIPQIYDFQILEGIVYPLKVAFVRFGWILPLAVLGCIVAGRERRALLVPYLAVIAVAWFQTAVFFAVGRYRLAVLAGFLGPAALGASWLMDRLRQRKLLVPAGVIALIVLLQLLPAAYPLEKARSFDAYQMAMRHVRARQPREALRWYREALRHAPESGEAWHGVGTTLHRMGQYPEAAEAYRRAIARMPRSALTYYALGLSLRAMGDLVGAIAAYRGAVEINPLNPRFRHDLGVALAESGQTEEAAAQWRRVLELAPDHQAARRNLERLVGGSP